MAESMWTLSQPSVGYRPRNAGSHFWLSQLEQLRMKVPVQGDVTPQYLLVPVSIV